MGDDKAVHEVDDGVEIRAQSSNTNVFDSEKSTKDTYTSVHSDSKNQGHGTTTSSPDNTSANNDLSSSSTALTHSRKTTLLNILTYIPPNCRHDPSRPRNFSWLLTILFAAAGCITVANLYYSHPILNLLARDFNVTYQQSSYIPTMAQAGYAVGLFLLNPPGDLLRRRPYILILVFITATLWIGLCITPNYSTFLALTFLTGITTVTPQLMMPLVGELAPPHRRATALSIVVAGLLLGLLVARLLSGVVTLYIGWRYIYWISFTLQSTMFILLWLFMPDYPSTNPEPTWAKTARKYPAILADTLRLPFAHPVLMQACLIGLLNGAPFTSFWTTLTFLLAGEPYNYSSLTIGLFALIGIAAMCFVPLFARLFMERHVPLLSVIVATLINLVGAIIGTVLGRHSVVGPVVQAATTEIGMQTAQVGNRTGIYSVDVLKGKQNRVNTAYMLGVFGGQLLGTGAGNAVYARAGWVGSGWVNVGLLGGSLGVCLLRGPHEGGWVGWGGGWEVRVRKVREREEEGKEREKKGEEKADEESGRGRRGEGEGEMEELDGRAQSSHVGKQDR